MSIFTPHHSKPSAVTALTVLIAATLLPAALQAQVSPPSITLVANALGCSTPGVTGGFSVATWRLGATLPANPLSGSGIELRGQRTSFSDVTVTKGFDECSAALFKAVALGGPIQTVTIAQSLGGVPKMTVVMTNVMVSGYDLAGANTAPLPIETIALRYDRITITNLSNGSKACYDTILGRSCN